MIAKGQNDVWPRLLVIGAGPAGVAAAIRLRDRGQDVLLVDRASFPRPKVCGCCLNLAAIDALAKIQCDCVVTALSASSLRRWELRVGDRRVDAPLPGGIAISRHAMDAALLREAARRGVQFRLGCDARVVDVRPHAVEVSLRDVDSETKLHEFDSVVFAAGLGGGGVSRWLPFTQAPIGPIGVGVIVDAMAPVVPRTIHMICGATGYVGLVQLGDGSINVAAAIRRKREPLASLDRKEIVSRVDALLRSGGMPSLQQTDNLQMTPRLTRARQVGVGGLIAVGDAAKYVEPFTGEGMAWAIESGIEAADCIADRIDQHRTNKDTLADSWVTRYRALARKRQWICRLLSGALRSESISACLVPAIRYAPWAAKMTIGQLNRTRS